MKFTISQEQLYAALSKISFALENKGRLEAYTHIALRGEGNRIRLTASNRDLDAEAKMGISGSVPRVQIGVSGALMSKVAGSLPAGPIDVSLDVPNLKLESASSTFTLPILSPEVFMETFPSHTDYNTDSMNYTEIDMGKLLHVFKKVWHCVFEGHQRPEYASVHINKDHIVATDGFRMAIHPNNIFPLETPILLHASQVPRLWKVYGGLGDKGGIFLEEKSSIHFVCGGIACGTRLRTGTFPSYRSILPSDEGSLVVVPRVKTLEALRRAVLVCKKDSYVVSAEIDNSNLTFKVDSEIGKSEECVTCENSEPHLLKLNGKYLADALSQVEGDSANIYFHYDEKGSPRMIIVKEGEYRNVILPVNG